MNLIEDWILSLADAWWVYLAVYVLSAFDGFFPVVPSESVIVTLSSLWSSSGRPIIYVVGLLAWAGAFTGDNVGYLIGRSVGWQRFRYLREGKGRAAVQAAESGLDKRALLFLMTARYIPFGRTAVNLVAGAVRYPHRKFWHRSLASTFVWAVYSCLIGAVAGSWFENHHLLAVTVALVLAVVIALVVERMVTALHRFLDRRAERRGAGHHGEQAGSAAPSPADADRPAPGPEAVGDGEAGTAPAPASAASPAPGATPAHAAPRSQDSPDAVEEEVRP